MSNRLQEWRFSNCSACPTQVCCYKFSVNIHGWDGYRIARQLDLNLERFTDYVEQSKPDSTGFRLRHDGPSYMLVMGKREEMRRPEGRGCMFLLDLPDDYHRCGIYEVRPYVCRVFPSSVYQGVLQFRRDDTCPPRSYDISKVDLGRWHDENLEGAMEKDLHVHFVALWNRRVDREPEREWTFGEFRHLLLNFYHRTEPLRLPPGPEARRVMELWTRWSDREQSPLDDGPGAEPYEPFRRQVEGFREGLRRLESTATRSDTTDR